MTFLIGSLALFAFGLVLGTWIEHARWERVIRGPLRRGGYEYCHEHGVYAKEFPCCPSCEWGYWNDRQLGGADSTQDIPYLTGDSGE